MAKKAQKQRLDWAKARAEYVATTKTLAEIAVQFGATPAATNKRAEREGWADDRRKLSERVAKGATDRIAKTRIAELAKFNADSLIVAKALKNQVKAHLVESQTSKVAITHEKLRVLAATAEVASRMGRVALGVNDKVQFGDDDDPPPESVKVTVVDASGAES